MNETPFAGSVVELALRHGGAHITLTIQMAGQTWRGQRILDGYEMRQSYITTTDMVNLAIDDLQKSIDLETTESVFGDR